MIIVIKMEDVTLAVQKMPSSQSSLKMTGCLILRHIKSTINEMQFPLKLSSAGSVVQITFSFSQDKETRNSTKECH